jgi:DNA polymerase
MRTNKQHTLTALGIEIWQLRAPQLAVSCKHTPDPYVIETKNKNVDVMLISEMLEGNGEAVAEPFSGSSGKLLDGMLQSIGLTREDVYISILKPDHNQDRMSAWSLIEKEIESISPKLILCLGATIARYLLKTDVLFDELRGKIHRYSTIPFIVTYHPCDLLKNPSDKRKAFYDLKLSSQTLNN